MSNQQHQPRGPVNPSWIWSGIHGESGTVHPFFAIRDDPRRHFDGLGYFVTKIIASSGGLLLIKRSRRLDMIDPRCRTGRSLIDGRRRDTAQADHDRSNKLCQQWRTLEVVNPSTHEFRMIPRPSSTEILRLFWSHSFPPANSKEIWSYNAVQANLLVDAESQTYTVTLTFPNFICFYKSASNAWQYRRFNNDQGGSGVSWGPQSTSNPWQTRSYNQGAHGLDHLPMPWELQIANACVNGRLFFADVVVDDDEDDPIPTMNLIEIDVEAGIWKRHNWHYPLETHCPAFISTTPLLRMRGLTEHGIHQAASSNQLQTLAPRSHDRGRLFQNFQIVECLGELYAVIPMGLREHVSGMSSRSQQTLTEVIYEYENFGLHFMPLQFLIVDMRGDGFVHGVLRIVVPENVSTEVVGTLSMGMGLDRRTVLMNMLQSEPPQDWCSWGFSCVAEGSVIWVALLDYALQYDLVTGLSKTEIIRPQRNPAMSLEIWVERVPYRPSDIKPKSD